MLKQVVEHFSMRLKWLNKNRVTCINYEKRPILDLEN